MNGNSITRPSNFENLDGKLQIRWNVKEVIKTLEDNSTRTEYSYEYNTKYIPIELNKDEIIKAIIAESYSYADEIKLAFSRDTDKGEKDKHEELVLKAKEWAKEVLA
jgi:hypothetical protein